ncbi:pathway-specific nitrogen regulator [Paramyrothecium foliicola]|nr:pathway-specific nitrogen regulator [Paramyrothecium foliicola]
MDIHASDDNAVQRQKDSFRVWTADNFGFNPRGNDKDKTRAAQRTLACQILLFFVTASMRALQTVSSTLSVDRYRWEAEKEAPSSYGSKCGVRSDAEPNIQGAEKKDDGQPQRHDSPPAGESIDAAGSHDPSSVFDNETIPMPMTSDPYAIESFRLSQGLFSGFSEAGRLNTGDEWMDVEDFIFDPHSPQIHSVRDTIELATTIPTLSSLATAKRSAPAPRRAIRLRYYRRLGPTAVVPGFRRLSAMVIPEVVASERADGSSPNPDMHTPLSHEAHTLTRSDQTVHRTPSDRNAGGPSQTVIFRILDVFFEHFEGHFPFVHPEILEGHVRAGEASGFLLNAIAALSLRFCPLDGPFAEIEEVEPGPKWRRGITFFRKAKEQLMSLISVPVPDVVSGLVILAWAAFGLNDEAGLWMLSGMAIRVAQDLGLHRTPETNPDPTASFHDHARPCPGGKITITDEQAALHQQKARLGAFWSVFTLDVYVSLITGRPPTFQRNEIEVDLPTAMDMKLAQVDLDEQITPRNTIFPQAVAMMVEFADALGLLNRTSHRSTSSETSSTNGQVWHARESTTQIQACFRQIVQNYKALPEELAFSANNHKLAAKHHHAGLFLTLHLFYHNFILLLTWRHDAPESLPGSSSLPEANPTLYETDHAKYSELSSLAMLTCQNIVQTAMVVNSIDHKGYISSPFTAHCLYNAASYICQDLKTKSELQESLSAVLHSSVASVDYNFLVSTLLEQGSCYASIGSFIAALRRQRDSGQQSSAGSTGDDDAEICSPSVNRLEDPGIIHRYTIR